MEPLDCAKREKMVQMVANGASQSDAYREAFKSKAKPETIHVNSSKIMAETKVKLRLKFLKDELAELGLWSRADSLRTLAEIAGGSDEEAKPSDRVNAVKAINQMQGWDAPTKIDHSSKDGSMATLTDQQRRLLDKALDADV